MKTTKRQLKSKLAKAKMRLRSESKTVDAAQRRKNYWTKVVRATEYRLGLVSEGQIEMDV